MNDKQQPVEHLFNEVPEVSLQGEISLFCGVTVSRRHIDIAEHEDDVGLMFTVDEARTLRDWLNKVLP